MIPLYELLNGNKLAKQRVVDEFSGDSLNERWLITLVGSATNAMDDTINGGVLLSSGATSDSASTINFDTISQYDYQSSRMIGIFKINQVSGGLNYHLGFAETGSSHYAFIRARNVTSANFHLLTRNTGTIGTTNTTIAYDTSVHSFMISQFTSKCILYIDGDLQVISTTNLPSAGQGLHATAQNPSNATNNSMNVRYIEAYNL